MPSHRPATPSRLLLPLLLFAFVVAGCRTAPEPAEPAPAVAEAPAPPTVTRGEFAIEADKLDTWNAIGQIAVRTPGVHYEGRAQMLDLYALRYGGAQFMVLTKAVPAADSPGRLTTRVTATTPAGKPIDHDAVAQLLALFQRELPAEITRVRAQQAAEKAAAQRAKAQKARKRKGK